MDSRSWPSRCCCDRCGGWWSRGCGFRKEGLLHFGGFHDFHEDLHGTAADLGKAFFHNGKEPFLNGGLGIVVGYVERKAVFRQGAWMRRIQPNLPASAFTAGGYGSKHFGPDLGQVFRHHIRSILCGFIEIPLYHEPVEKSVDSVDNFRLERKEETAAAVFQGYPQNPSYTQGVIHSC